MPPAWSTLAVLVGAALTGAAAGCWAWHLVRTAGLLPAGLAGHAQAVAAAVAGAVLGSGFALGLSLVVDHVVRLAR